MAIVNVVSLLLLLVCVFMFPCLSTSEDGNNNYVEEACSVTRYHDLCIHSLTPFANTAKDNPSKWARAGVSVTIGEAKRVARFLKTLTNTRNVIALSDCVDCFQSTLDNLHMSLAVLRNLSAAEFASQVEDVTTWVSAALTDEDTCLDGFQDARVKRERNLINRVTNASYLTSNALALLNKLATAGWTTLLKKMGSIWNLRNDLLFKGTVPNIARCWQTLKLRFRSSLIINQIASGVKIFQS